MLWNSNYETGNTTVDSEHKQIFEMVDKLLAGGFDSRPDKIKTTVDFLVDYVARHFDNEVKLMRESNYPETEAHIKQHTDFVAVVLELAEKIVGNLESIDLSFEVNRVIVTWLAEHTMTSDKRMVDHYKVWSKK